MTKYYNSYDGHRNIIAYDTENGVRNVGTISHPSILIHHDALIVHALFDTVDEALRDWGEWSERPVYLPDGTMRVPIEQFHPEYSPSPFIQWRPGIRELWPGEY